MKKALFIRLDRMGDLILTLPCDQRVKNKYEVHWFVPSGMDFVVENSVPARPFKSFSKDFTFSRFSDFLREVRKMRPEVSISFHVPWWVNLALFMCRVPVRGGVLSQWHSYLFLNKGLRQKRSQCEHHEMEYNFLLTEHSFDLPKQEDLWTPLRLKEPESVEMAFDLAQDYFVVHPGMGGSALNWPVRKYAELIDQLSQKATVVVTGTKTDEAWLRPLKMSLKENHKVVWLDSQLSGFQLLRLLKHSNATVAPSTGVLHLSASLGATSLGIYSPIKVHQDKRWGPKGPNTNTFSPSTPCPASFECLEKECPHYFCMETLEVSPVAEKALTNLSH